jgi:hypothetical protein
MQFHWRNLVVIPVAPDEYFRIIEPGRVIATQSSIQYRTDYTTYFTQIGQPFRLPQSVVWTSTNSPFTATINSVDQVLTCIQGHIDNCLFDQCTFQIQSSVNDALRSKYMQQPLIIPTNTLVYSKFSGQPGKNETVVNFQATLSQCLENCDSVFLLVPNNNFQETCFYQPYLEQVRLQLGEFGIHPSRYCKTWDDPRFIAMCLDSLNLERSDISSMNKEVARSFLQNRKCFLYSGTGPYKVTDKEELDLFGDRSNFFIGISLSQVGFQSGTVSSPNTNIPFIFEGTLNRDPGTDRDVTKNGRAIDTSLIAMFLLDCAWIIQVAPNSNNPIVKLTPKSVV